MERYCDKGNITALGTTTIFVLQIMSEKRKRLSISQRPLTTWWSSSAGEPGGEQHDWSDCRDIIGSVYEIHNLKRTDFSPFGPGCRDTSRDGNQISLVHVRDEKLVPRPGCSHVGHASCLFLGQVQRSMRSSPTRKTRE